MARPKAFDRERAVKQAMELFWEKGFEASSTEDLLRAMSIGRQSMYDTFGDKHQLYLEALRRYQAESGADLFERLRTTSTPLAMLADVLLAIAGETASARARGCMAVNATTEFGQSDPEVAALIGSGQMLCEAAFERVVREAKQRGEVAASVDERAAGRFLFSTIRGMRVSAKAGASPDALRDVATLAIEALKAR